MQGKDDTRVHAQVGDGEDMLKEESANVAEALMNLVRPSLGASADRTDFRQHDPTTIHTTMSFGSRSADAWDAWDMPLQSGPNVSSLNASMTPTNDLSHNQSHNQSHDPSYKSSQLRHVDSTPEARDEDAGRSSDGDIAVSTHTSSMHKDSKDPVPTDIHTSCRAGTEGMTSSAKSQASWSAMYGGLSGMALVPNMICVCIYINTYFMYTLYLHHIYMYSYILTFLRSYILTFLHT
jgi:hypothetical protein